MSEKGLALVKSFEGCMLKPYYCTGGVLTIGYGHTGSDVREGMTITKEEAERLLIKDIAWAEDVVERRVLSKVPLNQHQFDTLVSFVFNIGEGDPKKPKKGGFVNSTLYKRLIKGDYDQVPAQLARYKYSGGKVTKGLIRRRAAEAALWNEIPPPPAPTQEELEAEPMPQAVECKPPPVTALAKSRTIWGSGIGGAAAIGGWVLDTATGASSKVSESLSGTSALVEHAGSGKGTIVLIIVLCSLAVVIGARVQDWMGGRG